jgi:hypothetical protein
MPKFKTATAALAVSTIMTGAVVTLAATSTANATPSGTYVAGGVPPQPVTPVKPVEKPVVIKQHAKPKLHFHQHNRHKQKIRVWIHNNNDQHQNQAERQDQDQDQDQFEFPHFTQDAVADM